MRGREVIVGDAGFDGTVHVRPARSPLYLVMWAVLAGVLLCLVAYVDIVFSITAGEALKAFIWRMRYLTFGPIELSVLVLGFALRKGWRLHRTPPGLLGFIAFLIMTGALLSVMMKMENTSVNTDWVRLQLHKSAYMRDIAGMNGKGPHVRVWEWGSTMKGTAHGTAYDVIYDDADQVLQPAENRPDEWRQAAGAWANISAYSTDEVKVTIRPVEGHFYLVAVTQ